MSANPLRARKGRVLFIGDSFGDSPGSVPCWLGCVAAQNMFLILGRVAELRGNVVRKLETQLGSTGDKRTQC
eukprot:2226000-Amphidinium_carterae.1